jgi:hypothetical protein
MSDSTISDAILSGDTADIYFHNARKILQQEKLDPVVTMEIFPGRDGYFAASMRRQDY